MGCKRPTNSLVLDRDTTPVPPIALVLFGGSLSASQKLSTSRPGEALLSVDGWITVSVSARVQKLLVLVRQHLDNLLQEKVADPTATFSAGSEKLLQAVVALLAEGEQEKLRLKSPTMCLHAAAMKSQPAAGLALGGGGGGGGCGAVGGGQAPINLPEIVLGDQDASVDPVQLWV